MAGSARIQVKDARAIWSLVGECREMGDDRVAWRSHCVGELARLVDADMGVVGEMAGCHSLRLRDLGASYWCQLAMPAADRVPPILHRFRIDPGVSPAMLEYHRRNGAGDGLSLTRRDLFEERDWARLDEMRVINEALGTDATLWCFRRIPSAAIGESCGIVLSRARRRRDFNARERALIHEVNASLAPMLGRELARSREPSPSDLTPRVRQVLACLLEGDGDKQVASRLGLGRHTVNEYTKVLFRHFGVSGRSELLARWVRRGWGGRFAWADPIEVGSDVLVRTATGYRASLEPAGR